MDLECPNCKKQFVCETRKYNEAVKNGYKNYCTIDCAYEARRKAVKTICAFCEKEIVKPPAQIRRSKTGNLYCNRSCAASKNNTLFKTGNKHGNFKNGISSYRRIKLKNAEPECENCGIDTICVLQVHHKDKDRNNNDIDNLELLCANCHLMKHNGII